ncbi:MAG: hypothetical protein EXR62_08260 [Chloroflexi bacterium]|nr:hypothetical protein [Chloroflexota bacterium]
MDQPYSLKATVDLPAAGQTGVYPLTWESSAAGKVRGECRLDPAAAELQDAVIGLRGLSQLRTTPEQAGARLFDALVPAGPVRDWFNAAMESCHSGNALHIHLEMHPPELLSLSWELLFQPDLRQFLLAIPGVEIERYTESGGQPQATGAAELSVAVVMSTLDLQAEFERLQQSLAVGETSGKTITLVNPLNGSADWGQLLAQQMGSTVLHLAAPVRDNVFEVRPGVIVPVKDLAGILQQTPVRLVVLDPPQGGAMSSTIPAASEIVRYLGVEIVALQFPLPRSAAERFFRYMYAGLQDGLAVIAAVEEGRKALRTMGRSMTREDPQGMSWTVPALLTNQYHGDMLELSRREAHGATKSVIGVLRTNYSSSSSMAVFSDQELPSFQATPPASPVGVGGALPVPADDLGAVLGQFIQKININADLPPARKDEIANRVRVLQDELQAARPDLGAIQQSVRYLRDQPDWVADQTESLLANPHIQQAIQDVTWRLIQR